MSAQDQPPAEEPGPLVKRTATMDGDGVLTLDDLLSHLQFLRELGTPDGAQLRINVGRDLANKPLWSIRAAW